MTQKKGMALGTIAKYLIGIAILIIVAAIFFIGPEALFNKIKDVIPRADTAIPRGSYETGDDNTRPAQDKVTDVLIDMQAAFATMQESSAADPDTYCFYALSEEQVSTLKKGYYIQLVELENNLILSLQRDIPAPNELAAKPQSTVLSYTVNDASPCLVYGESQAQAFYDAWLGNNPTFTPSGNQYQTSTGFVLQYGWIVTQDAMDKDAYNELRWKTDDDETYLVFVHDKHFCFLPTSFDRTNDRCSEPEDGMIDNDCIDTLIDQAEKDKLLFYDEDEKRCIPFTT